ncbi:Adhesion G-protein coupled receptor G4 [Apodemus speciosus]|uniref:Adhesion G-protein coupled receptor G4 n=1 Tax=Apodemus speciosus TaxID=105296 RepID=A0ABQ0FUG4_APOSI
MDSLSLKGKRLDFYGEGETYVSLTNTMPELSRLTACIDLISMTNNSHYWMAFYITNNTLLGREDVDLGLAGDHQQLILYNFGKTFYVSYHLIPFHWHTLCLVWDGAKGRLELFRNKERILATIDQPRSLSPNGTLVLGHFPRNGEGQIKTTIPRFMSSLYYFQLWDRILENEEFMTCLYGNVVSWEDDVWLIHKISPTVDRRLRCFVSENMTIQETSTNVPQQIDLTTSQTTGLNPHKTGHSSTLFPEGMPVSTIKHTAISYSNTVPSSLATVSASKDLKTSTTKTTTFSTDTLFTSTAIPLPTQKTPIDSTTDYMNVTEHSYLAKTRTSKMVEAMATATDLIDTSVFTKNYTVSETSTPKSKSAVGKTTLFLKESTSIATTPCPKPKSTDAALLHTFKSGQEFLLSSGARTVSWSTLEETSPITTDVGIVSTFPPESLLPSTASPVNSTFPEIQVASTLSTTDAEMPFTVHSVLPMESMPALRTVKQESVSSQTSKTDFQGLFSPSIEDAISASMLKEPASMAFSSITSSPVTRTQDEQIVIDAESTHPTVMPRTKLVPTLAEASLFPTMEGLVYTQDTPTTDESMLTLISTKSPIYNASESGLTSITIKSDYQFFTNETTWTSKSGQTLLTSMNTTTIPTFTPNETLTLPFRGNTTNIDYSSITTNVTPFEASTESNVTTSSDATTARSTTALFKSTSQWLSNFTRVSGITSIASHPESKLTTLLLKSNSVPTVAANELPSIPREPVAPSVDTSTLTDIKPTFSTEKSIYKTIQIETNDVSTFGDSMAPLPMSVSIQRVYTTVTKENTSHHPKVKSTIAEVAEVSPFSTMLGVTDESAQMVTASVTVSPFANIEKLTTALNKETATAEVGVSWLPTKLKERTPESSHNGTTENFNSTHTYTVDWTSETSEGKSASSPKASTQALPELLSSLTMKTIGVTFSTNPSQRTAASLSTVVLSPQTAPTHSSAIPQLITRTLSLPVNISAVTSPATSMVFFDETKVTLSQPSTLARDFTTSVPSVGLTLPAATMTTELVPPVSPTASTIIDSVSTHRDLLQTTSAVTAISSTTAHMAFSPLRETLVSSLRPPTPAITKALSTIPSISADLVSPSIHTLVCSRPSPNNITIVSSTYVSSTTSTSAATPSESQVEASTYGSSFPYAFSGGYVNMASGATGTSAAGEAMPPNTFANKFITSVDRESTTYFVNTPVSTQSVFTTFMVSSDKEQTNISMEKTSRTTGVAKISPSKNAFILDSQSTFPWEMTDTELSETTEISSHQTHLPSEILPGYLSSGNLTASSTSGSTQSAQTLTSSTIIGFHVSERPTSLEKTVLPSQVQTVTKSLSPDKERTSALSEYPPRTVEKIVSSSPVTHQATGHLATSFVDAFQTTRISHPVLINTTLSHLLSLKTQPEATQTASSTSGSTENFSKPFSSFTTGLLSTNFSMITPDGSTTDFSLPNEPTNFPKETSMEASAPIYQMASLPLNVTAFTSKKVSDTLTMLMTKSPRTIHSDNLKSVSIGTFGLKSERSSMPVNNSDFSTTVLYPDTSTRRGAFFTSLSSLLPKTTKSTQASTLDTTPVAHAGPTSQGSFSNSPVVPLNHTTAHVSSPTQRDLLSIKTISTISTTGISTSVIGATPSSLPSSKNTEAISSIPKTVFSLLLSSTQQQSQENAAPTLDILPGITASSGGATELINAHSLESGKMNILTSELSKSSPCMTAPVLHPLRIQTSTALPSLTSHLYSPHGTEAKFLLASQMAEYPARATSVTPTIAEALLTMAGNTHRVEDSHLPVFTTKVMTPNRMEVEPPQFPSGTLPTSATSQIGLVSRDATVMPSIVISESFPTLGISGSTSLSVSSTLPPTTLAAILHTFEKTATPVTPGTTFSSDPSVISRATSPTWSLSSLPSDSQTSVSTPQLLTSGEMSESTFPASDMIATYSNFTEALLSDESATIPTQATSATTLGTITADSLTSLPISAKNKDDSLLASTFLEPFSRATVADSSTAMSEPMSFSRMSISPSITSHDLSIGSLSVSSPTNTSLWSKVPATSEYHTLFPSKPTLDSVMSIDTTTSTAIGTSFPLMSTEMTHPSTATGFSSVSSSFETSWMDSIFSSLFTQPSTSPIATVSTVSFYNIKMSFSVFDEEPRVLITTVIHELTKDWLNFMFQNSEFSLANLAIEIKSRSILEQKKGQGMDAIFHVPYSCACWVIIKAKSSLESSELISGIRTKIHGNLTHGNFTQDQLTLLVKSDHVVVEKLEPGKCEADETPSKYKGTYKWPLTDPTETAQERCIKNENRNATRICSISIQTGKCQWENPRLKQCKLLQGLPDKIVDLANITISDGHTEEYNYSHLVTLKKQQQRTIARAKALYWVENFRKLTEKLPRRKDSAAYQFFCWENADDVAEHILNLVNESLPLDEEETKIIVSKVADISNCDEISINLTQTILQIISTMTEKQSDSASNLPPVSNEILRIIERAGHKMEFAGRTANLTVAKLALAVLRVDHKFEGMAFSIRSSEEVTAPQLEISLIFLGDIPLRKALVSIYLPKSLREKVPLDGLQTILFNFFGQTSLFKTKNITTELMTYVVSASISNTPIQNLADPVIIILKHIQEDWNYDQVYCAFWDFDTNNGLGGWNPSGCKLKESNINYTICQCNHLTHFGVLMDLSRSTVDAVNERILVIITYTGCGISSIFLGIAMVTYIAFHKLRKDYPSKILINLCTALLMLNLAFLVNSWLTSFQKVGLCITAAVALHYFLLVSLTWMGLEAVHMYFALVKVFNTYIPNYILKFCLAGWGIPAITVTIILSVRKDLYGTLNPTTPLSECP